DPPAAEAQGPPAAHAAVAGPVSAGLESHSMAARRRAATASRIRRLATGEPPPPHVVVHAFLLRRGHRSRRASTRGHRPHAVSIRLRPCFGLLNPERELCDDSPPPL